MLAKDIIFQCHTCCDCGCRRGLVQIFVRLNGWANYCCKCQGRAGRAENRAAWLFKRISRPVRCSTPIYAKLSSLCNNTIKRARTACLPPYFFFCIVRAESVWCAATITFLQQIKNTMEDLPDHLRLLDYSRPYCHVKRAPSSNY